MACPGLGEKQFSEWLMVHAVTQADDFQLLCLLHWANSNALTALWQKGKPTTPTSVFPVLKTHLHRRWPQEGNPGGCTVSHFPEPKRWTGTLRTALCCGASLVLMPRDPARP